LINHKKLGEAQTIEMLLAAIDGEEEKERGIGTL
jgi:hypothetical protein